MSRTVGRGRPGRSRPGYEQVRDAFGEVSRAQAAGTGAALAAVVDGRLVVDLWGGAADPAGMPWQEDTSACCTPAPRAWSQRRC